MNDLSFSNIIVLLSPATLPSAISDTRRKEQNASEETANLLGSLVNAIDFACRFPNGDRWYLVNILPIEAIDVHAKFDILLAWGEFSLIYVDIYYYNNIWLEKFSVLFL